MSKTEHAAPEKRDVGRQVRPFSSHGGQYGPMAADTRSMRAESLRSALLETAHARRRFGTTLINGCLQALPAVGWSLCFRCAEFLESFSGFLSLV
jgi:hypothetical protein